MSIDQLLMLTSFIIIFGIFLRKPLIFALSPSELLELHILRKNEEKIPVFSHSFSANNRNSANLKKNDKQNRSSIDNQENGGNTHQILPYIIISVMDLLKEATESEQRDENIKQIKYGDTFINIEYSEHYIALLLTKNLDFLYNFALRKMLKDVEQKYSENISDDGTSGSEEVGKTLFYALLEENFSFSFQKDGQDIDRDTNQGEAF